MRPRPLERLRRPGLHRQPRRNRLFLAAHHPLAPTGIQQRIHAQGGQRQQNQQTKDQHRPPLPAAAAGPTVPAHAHRRPHPRTPPSDP